MEMSDLTDAFLEELEEQLQVIENGILALEQSSDIDVAIQNLFRAAHTLKGSSAAMGIDEMKELTHQMEDVLDAVRHGTIAVSPAMVELLLACFDCLGVLKDEFVAGQGITTRPDALVERLHQFMRGGGQTASPGAKDHAVSAAVDQAHFQGHINQIRGALEQGRLVAEVQAVFSEFAVMRAARAYLLTEELATIGEVLWTAPSLDDPDDNDDAAWLEYRVYLMVQSMPSAEQVAAFQSSDYARIDVQPLAFDAIESPVTSEIVRPVKGNAGASAEDEPAATNEAPKRKQKSIRVDVQRLEELMNLTGELVIDQARIAQISGDLNRSLSANEQIAELSDLASHVSRVVSELQESIMRARMMTLEPLFGRFPRMVRDLAQSLQKEVDFIIEGQETQLDRTVIEEIGDPLIHLIRNAIDHGIESPADRTKQGKPGKGTLRLTATQEGSNVVIAIEDDGSGMDPGRLRESAVQKGVITSEEAQALSDADALGLIFRPGFSTAATISDVSGRGVGMEIVKTNLERLQGVIDADSHVGQGTRFRVTLPLTLSIISGLLIRVGRGSYVIPMGSVIEIVRVRPEELIGISGQPMIHIRDRLTPVKWLHDILNIERPTADRTHLPLVVIGAADRRLALVIDELRGHQEVVKKPLGTSLRVEGISGATILGDGRVATILDTAGLMSRV